MTRALALGVALLATASNLQAQADSTALVPGARVRIHRESGSTTGSLVSLDSTSLVLATEKSDTVTAPLSSITKVDVSRGKKSRAGRGALMGLAVGTAVGVIAGVAASGSDDSSWLDFNAGAWATGTGLTGAVLGTGIGAIIGATQHTDRWEPTVLPTVSIQPAGGDDRRVGLGLRLRF